ncbi:MAG: hypothetical protein OEY56_03420 [Cyclobacteriaceae bacterium]|nr:hypothetical protein [Cyclobacteriaceae bacterium]
MKTRLLLTFAASLVLASLQAQTIAPPSPDALDMAPLARMLLPCCANKTLSVV